MQYNTIQYNSNSNSNSNGAVCTVYCIATVLKMMMGTNETLLCKILGRVLSICRYSKWRGAGSDIGWHSPRRSAFPSSSFVESYDKGLPSGTPSEPPAQASTAYVDRAVRLAGTVGRFLPTVHYGTPLARWHPISKCGRGTLNTGRYTVLDVPLGLCLYV
jgi:hypothetical protein